MLVSFKHSQNVGSQPVFPRFEYELITHLISSECLTVPRFNLLRLRMKALALVTAIFLGACGGERQGDDSLSNQLSANGNKQCLAQLEKIETSLARLMPSEPFNRASAELGRETLSIIDSSLRALAEVEASQQLRYLQADLQGRAEIDRCLLTIARFRYSKLHSPEVYGVISHVDVSPFDTATQHMVNKWLQDMRHTGVNLPRDQFEVASGLRVGYELNRIRRQLQARSKSSGEDKVYLENIMQGLGKLASQLGYPTPLAMARELTSMPAPGALEVFLGHASGEIDQYIEHQRPQLSSNILAEDVEDDLHQLSQLPLNNVLALSASHPIRRWGVSEWQLAIHQALTSALGLELIPLASHEDVGVGHGYEIFYQGKALGRVIFHTVKNGDDDVSPPLLIASGYPSYSDLGPEAASRDAMYHLYISEPSLDKDFSVAHWKGLTAAYGKLVHVLMVNQTWWSNGSDGLDSGLMVISTNWFNWQLSSYDFLQFGIARQIKKQEDLTESFQSLQRVMALLNAQSAQDQMRSARKIIELYGNYSSLNPIGSQELPQVNPDCDGLCIANVLGFFVANQLIGYSTIDSELLEGEVVAGNSLSQARKRINKIFSDYRLHLMQPGGSRHAMDIIVALPQVDLQGALILP